MVNLERVLLHNEFSMGDIVRITDGTLSGYEGVFKANSGDERVVILLNVMGNQSDVKVDIDVIERVT